MNGLFVQQESEWAEATTAVQALLAQAVTVEPVGAGKGHSGAGLQRVVLADGRTLIVKRIDLASDLTMRLTQDRGRAATLWLSGVLARAPAVIDHAMVAAAPERDGWVLLMRDVSDSFIPVGRDITRAENRRIIAAMVALHDAFRGEIIGELCNLETYCGLLTPEAMAAVDETENPFTSWVLRGWEYFAEIAPADVAEAVFAHLRQPGRLAGALEARPATLIHGDLYVENLGLYPERVVMLDWGLATRAPSAVEFATYLAMNGLRLESGWDEAAQTYRQLAGPNYDAEATQLAWLLGMATYGWRMGMFAREWGDETTWPRIEAEFAWWIARTREALALWSPQ
jgi:hypothetical protein